ncbi:unnamed protein product, partial [Musa textilis]
KDSNFLAAIQKILIEEPIFTEATTFILQLSRSQASFLKYHKSINHKFEY